MNLRHIQFIGRVQAEEGTCARGIEVNVVADIHKTCRADKLDATLQKEAIAEDGDCRGKGGKIR